MTFRDSVVLLVVRWLAFALGVTSFSLFAIGAPEAAIWVSKVILGGFVFAGVFCLMCNAYQGPNR